MADDATAARLTAMIAKRREEIAVLETALALLAVDDAEPTAPAPPSRRTRREKHEAIAAELTNGKGVREAATAAGVSKDTVTAVARALVPIPTAPLTRGTQADIVYQTAKGFREPWTSADIARRSGIGANTVAAVLTALAAKGYVEPIEEGGGQNGKRYAVVSARHP